MQKEKIKWYYLSAIVVFLIASATITIVNEKKMVTVKLFLKDKESGKLVVQRSLIPKTESINERIFWILKELISGPIQSQYERILDPNIEVKEIIIKRKTAYLSFNWMLINSLHKNSTLVLDSIVKSVLMNVKELDEVKILVEGVEPVGTFFSISLEKTFQ